MSVFFDKKIALKTAAQLLMQFYQCRSHGEDVPPTPIRPGHWHCRDLRRKFGWWEVGWVPVGQNVVLNRTIVIAIVSTGTAGQMKCAHNWEHIRYALVKCGTRPHWRASIHTPALWWLASKFGRRRPSIALYCVIHAFCRVLACLIWERCGNVIELSKRITAAE